MTVVFIKPPYPERWSELCPEWKIRVSRSKIKGCYFLRTSLSLSVCVFLDYCNPLLLQKTVQETLNNVGGSLNTLHKRVQLSPALALHLPLGLNLWVRPFWFFLYTPHIHSPSANGHKSPSLLPPEGSGILRPCFQSWNGELRAKPGSQLLHFHVLWLQGISFAVSQQLLNGFNVYDRHPYDGRQCAEAWNDIYIRSGHGGGITCIGAVSCNVPNPACVNDLSSALTFPVPKQAYKLPLETRWKFGFAAHWVAECTNVCTSSVQVRLWPISWLWAQLLWLGQLRLRRWRV